MNSDVNTDRGKVIGLGRIQIPKDDNFNYELPWLAFLIFEKPDGEHIASCIPLQIDGYGKTYQESHEDLLDNILYFLKINFTDEESKDSGWSNLVDLVNTSSNEMWKLYYNLNGLVQDVKRDATESLRKRTIVNSEEVNKPFMKTTAMTTDEMLTTDLDALVGTQGTQTCAECGEKLQKEVTGIQRLDGKPVCDACYYGEKMETILRTGTKKICLSRRKRK